MPFKLLFRLIIAIGCLTALLVGTAVRFSLGQAAGQWIPLANIRMETGLYLYDMETGVLVNLTGDRVDQEYPVLSPDNQSVAFTMRQDINYDVYLRSLWHDDITRVTTSVSYDAFPAWSPDGKQLAYVSGYNNADIYVLDPQNPEPRRLTDNPGGDTTPDWSPDGSWIVYVTGSSTDAASLYAIDAHCPAHCDTRAIQLTGTGHEFFPAWSPDGQQIAYIGDQGKTWGIYVIDAVCLLQHTVCQRPPPHLLATAHITMSRLSWSRDSQQVMFLAEDRGFPALYAVHTDCPAACTPQFLTAIDRSFLGLHF
jgi:Tol biopolymer transport system component